MYGVCSPYGWSKLEPACEQATEDSGLFVPVLSSEFIIRATVHELRQTGRENLRQVYIASAACQQSPLACFDVLYTLDAVRAGHHMLIYLFICCVGLAT